MSRHVLAVLGVLAGALVYHGSYVFHGIAPYDEGILLDGVMRIRAGEVFARDFFAPYGPGRYALLALWFELTGPSLASYRTLVWLILALSQTALFHLAWRLSGGVAALGATLWLALAHGALHKSFLLLSLVLVLGGASLALQRRDARSAALAGLAIGAAFLLRYDVGVFGAVALALGMAVAPRRPWPEEVRRLWHLAAGLALLPVGLALLLLAAGASPGEWVSHTLHRISIQEAAHLPFPWPLRDGRLAPISELGLFVMLLAWLAGYGLLVAGALRRRVRRETLPGDDLRVTVASLGLLLLNQTRLMATHNRLFQVGAPAYLTVSDLLARRGRPWSLRVLLLGLVAAVLAWIYTLPANVYIPSHRARLDGARPLALERGGVFLSAAYAERLELLVQRIQREVPAGEPLATAPGCPLLAFLAERRLAQPYAEPSYYYRSERAQEIVIDALERSKPPLLVDCPSMNVGLTLEHDAPRIATYLKQHYRPLAAYPPYVLLRREP